MPACSSNFAGVTIAGAGAIPDSISAIDESLHPDKDKMMVPINNPTICEIVLYLPIIDANLFNIRTGLIGREELKIDRIYTKPPC